MTETCSGISGFWIKEHPSKLSSSGEAFDGVSIYVVNNRITVDCKMNMKGYYMEEKLKDNILITSDLGALNNGFLYIINSRDRDVIISGGEKININYVKNILLAHKAIESVSIRTIKDKKWGKSIKADIILTTNELNSNDIKKWCKSKMSNYSIPQKIKIVTK